MAAERTPLSILVVYAHVADLATEASGTIAIHADLGDAITAVICSDGERHHEALFLDDEEAPGRPAGLPTVRATLAEIRAIKRREARRAADVLGVGEVVFLGWEDGFFDMNRQRIDELAGVILRVKPDLILAHLPHNNNGDLDPHATVGRLVVWARNKASTRIRQVDGIAAHHAKEIMFFAMGGEIADSRDLLSGGIVCDVWVDITPVIARKVQAFDQIVSQGYHGSLARKAVEARDGRWGMLAGTSYAEPFLRGGRTYDSLPMSDRTMRKVFSPTDLPGDRILAPDVPSAVPDDAFQVPAKD